MTWLTALALLCITVLEIIALLKGMDGTMFAAAIAAIALLAPSPLFQIQWRHWRILKGLSDGGQRDEKDAQSDNAEGVL